MWKFFDRKMAIWTYTVVKLTQISLGFLYIFYFLFLAVLDYVSAHEIEIYPSFVVRL